MNVEDRLRDLREATRGQLRPSPLMFTRIEESIERPPGRARVMALAGAVAVLAVVVALALGRTNTTQHVATRPPTRAEFVAGANQRCADFVERRAQVQVVFPTPQAYSLAADNLIDVLTRAIDDSLTLGAADDARPLLKDSLAELREALVDAQHAKDLADASDAAGAAAALADVDAIQAKVGNALADYGATQCRAQVS